MKRTALNHQILVLRQIFHTFSLRVIICSRPFAVINHEKYACGCLNDTMKINQFVPRAEATIMLVS